MRPSDIRDQRRFGGRKPPRDLHALWGFLFIIGPFILGLILGAVVF